MIPVIQALGLYDQLPPSDLSSLPQVKSAKKMSSAVLLYLKMMDFLQLKLGVRTPSVSNVRHIPRLSFLAWP